MGRPSNKLLKQYDIDNLFQNPDEIAKARELLERYVEDYSIETVSDKNLLRQLIFLEVNLFRAQQNVNKGFEKTEIVSGGSMKIVHDLNNEIVKLKQMMGMTKEEQGKSDAFSIYQKLVKKYRNYLKTVSNADRTFTCPGCGKQVLMMHKMDKWDTKMHPFIKGRIVGNDHIIKLYNDKTLTKEDLGLIFGTSPHYTDWLVERWEKPVKQKGQIDQEKEKKVDEKVD